MNPKQKKYILENINKKSIKEIALNLGLKVKKVRKFLDEEVLLANLKKAGSKNEMTFRIPDKVKKIALLLPIGVILIATFMCYSNLISRNQQGNFTHMIKWDIFDFTYPLLIFNSDCIRSLVFPFWNPYTFGGMSYASNPQAGLFNPINLLFIFFKGYSLELLQIQVFVIFFIGGVNMYVCLKNFSLSIIASLIGAISFLGCGFFVGNTEHFSHINVLAFFPLALMLVNKLINMPNLYNLSFGTLIIPLLVFCGYPGIIIIALYALFIFGMLKIFFIDNNLRTVVVSKKLLYFLSFFVLGLCASGVLLIPAFENVFLSVRGAGAPLESVRLNSLPLVYLSDIWYPFLALKNFPKVSIDIVLINCTIGLVGLFFAIYYLIFNKTRLKWSLLLLLLVSLIMALGTNTPFYLPIIKFVPFIKHIRHPSLDYRAFFLFFSCIFAGFGAGDMLKGNGNVFKRSLICFVVFFLTALSIAFCIKSKYGIEIMELLIKNYPFMLLSLVFLLVMVILTRSPYKKWLGILFLIFCIIDISYWTKVNFLTIADADRNDAWVYIKNLELNRNTRVDNNTIFKRRSALGYPVSTRDNFALISKYFTNGGYDPLILKYYDDLLKSPNGKVITENFRVLPIYEVKLFRDEKDVLLTLNSSDIDLHKVALVNEKDIIEKGLLDKFKNLPFKVEGNFSAKILHYDPNRIDYEIENANPALIFFNEIYYPGWRLYSNGKKLALLRINHAFRGVYLDVGKHLLTMTFFPNSFKFGFLLSMVSFLFIFFTICARRFKKL